MCLSTVYVNEGGQERELCSHVSTATAQEGKVSFTDIMGQTTIVEGRIASVDLVANRILVEAAS